MPLDESSGPSPSISGSILDPETRASFSVPGPEEESNFNPDANPGTNETLLSFDQKQTNENIKGISQKLSGEGKTSVSKEDINKEYSSSSSSLSSSTTTNSSRNSNSSNESNNNNKKDDVPTTASALMATFGNVKAGDPDALGNNKKLSRMREGLIELLDIHNPDEIYALCGSLGISTIPIESSHEYRKKAILKWMKNYKRGEIVDHIRNSAKFQEGIFHQILERIWEGIIFEYLRSKGKQVRAFVEPKKALMGYWLEDVKMVRSHTSMYIERRNRLRDEVHVSADISKLVDCIDKKEVLVKGHEKRMRVEHDYRNILQYLDGIADLRNTEKATRNWMKDEIIRLRSEQSHQEHIFTLMKDQAKELEERYFRVTDVMCKRLGEEEMTNYCLTNMISNTKAIEVLIRNVCDEMEKAKLPKIIGPEGEISTKLMIKNKSSSSLLSSSSTVDTSSTTSQEKKKKKRFLNTTSPFVLKETGTLMKGIKTKYIQHMNALANANKALVAEKEERGDEITALETVVSKERERAEKAEAKVKEYQSKMQLMNDVWAKETTRLEREVDAYQKLSLDNSTNLYIVEQQILAAKEILIPMLGSNDWLAARKSAELLLVLNILDDEEILRLTEMQRMKREEDETRFFNAILAIREDIKLAAKKAKKGKKGKKGKGKGKKGKKK